ncbi:MAG: hypothetical protein LQ343_003336 [Gyalolechia ehrenbergii]|nr:MAG: hypothetical protein LQ343_003336 [Gyalolechia ehrenbergii]
MRIPSFPNLIRTFYTISNATTSRFFANSPASQKAFAPFTRGTVLQSMPTIPFLGSLFTSSAKDMTDYPVKKSDEEWRAVLNPEQFRILRTKGTEPPFTGAYDKHTPPHGTYTCAGCSAPLYRATHKFKSGCGWPAYFDSIPGAVVRHTDRTFGMERTEIVCANCGGHLGHVFKGEGYPTPTDERHCVNSISLRFTEAEDEVKAGVVGKEGEGKER